VQPVIVVGMHRSGTSAVARVLNAIGVFMGADLQRDHESRTFIAVNEALLQRYGASWDAPAAVNRAWQSGASLAALRDRVRRRLNGALGEAYLGPDRGWVDVTARPWGWKDPRTSFTLPLWHALWPAAPVVCVERNGVDVAASLRRRHERVRAHYRERNGCDPPDGGFRLGNVAFTHRPATLAGGFAMWQEHAANLARLREAATAPWLTVRYEDLLADPAEEIDRMAAFCGLAPARAQVATAAEMLAGAHAMRFPGDAELSRFAADLLATGANLYGYRAQIAGALGGTAAAAGPADRSRR
jgi:hypothetical protein